MASCRVSIIQVESTDDVRANLESMKEHVLKNAASDLIVFPELALHGHDVSTGPPGEMRRALRGVSEEEIREFDGVIAESRAHVVYGKLVEREGRLYNLATASNGTERVSYAKTHVHWTEDFARGTEFPIVRSFKVPLGMLICFDAAFPEVARALALRGAEIIVNISAIPETFPLKHVHRRLVACSVQNQVYTVFANRAGKGFLGQSAIVHPEGDMLAVAGERGTLTVDIDLDEVRRWRAEEPLFPHRRPEIYGEISNTDRP